MALWPLPGWTVTGGATLCALSLLAEPKEVVIAHLPSTYPFDDRLCLIIPGYLCEQKSSMRKKIIFVMNFGFLLKILNLVDNY